MQAKYTWSGDSSDEPEWVDCDGSSIECQDLSNEDCTDPLHCSVRKDQIGQNSMWHRCACEGGEFSTGEVADPCCSVKFHDDDGDWSVVWAGTDCDGADPPGDTADCGDGGDCGIFTYPNGDRKAFCMQPGPPGPR